MRFSGRGCTSESSTGFEPVRFAVVIPMYNEEAGAEACVRAVCGVLAEIDPEARLFAVEDGSSDRTGEIQLTNGLRRLLRDRPIYVCEIDGVRHDTGNKLGFLKALVYFALRRPDLAEPFRRYLESLDLKIEVET